MSREAFGDLVSTADTLVIIQADNPDGDSLATALALEQLLSRMGKSPILYCGVEIPSYLRYMNGWDRIAHELPNRFDASIIIDTSALSLLETLQKSGEINWLKTKPCAILDHHKTEKTIDFASVSLIERSISTGELLYKTARDLDWEVDETSAEFVAISILADSLGLTSEAVTAETFEIMGELLDHGVSIAKLDEARKSLSKKSPRILTYKGTLLQRVEYYDDPRIATITIPWSEIETYSHEYNPSMLVIDEMRMVENVCVAVAFKVYPDGKITAKIRSNYGYKVAGKLAEHFGGGGHDYAAGFKLQDKRNIDDVKKECLTVAGNLLGPRKESTDDEVIQHTF